jgi:hypothetical protein
MLKCSFEIAENAVYQLLATLTAHNLFEFPGRARMRINHSDIKGDAIAIACTCAKSRFEGKIQERTEARLETMHAYGLVDLVELRHFVEDWLD